MSTLNFKHVYVLNEAVIVGPIEKKGPLTQYFDHYVNDYYLNQASYEQAEMKLVEETIDLLLKKAKLTMSDCDLAIGGDLMNQNATSNYVAKKLDCPFISVYGACSNAALVMGEAALMVQQGFKNVLAFTSSHNKSAERQFRYPNEYGIQRKETTTTTVTGAGAVILSNQFSDIQVTSFTIGKVKDWDFTNVNDMGSAMVWAAYDTLLTHFKDTNRTFDDYDLIVTGDLSKNGYAMLSELIQNQRFQLKNKLNDCGLMIYDINHQEVYCGGSGCACSMVVTLTKLFDELRSKRMKRVLLVATGCLHSVTHSQQKLSIPTVAHAICFERS